MPAEAVFENRTDESDFDRIDELVLPSLEGKTLFVNIASDNEAEDGAENEQAMTRRLVQGGESILVDETDAQGPGCERVQVVHAEWAPRTARGAKEVRRRHGLSNDRCEERARACARGTWSYGPQRKVRRN